MFICHYYENMLMSKVLHPLYIQCTSFSSHNDKTEEKKELGKVIMIYYSCRFA